MTTCSPPAGALPLRLPVIDFHAWRFGDARQRADAARRIAEACGHYGFFYLTGHGVSAEAIGAGFEAARRFFAEPLDRRMACRSTVRRQNRGYQPMYDSQHPGSPPDVKESFDMGFPLPPDDADQRAGLPFHGPNNWPELPGFRPLVEGLYFALLEAGRDVLRAMAEALGVDRNFFVAHCTRPYTNMRLVHYPPQPPRTEAGIGTTAHSDKGLITMLLNDGNGGLQVQLADGRWIDAVPRADALIVNVGQLLERWTNGRFRAAVHRVINDTGRERYSIPQFHHPDYRTCIDPRELSAGVPARYEPVIAGDYVAGSFSRERRSWAQEAATAAG